MATGVTSISPYAAAPPPPPIGSGSRKNKHIVGGQTSNVAYMPGQNLLNAREGFQNNQANGGGQSALQRGFFQGQVANAPDFSQIANNQMQAGQQPSAMQASGNTLFQHSLGNLRAANAPAGLGFGRSNALGAVRQHTLTGNEALDTGVSYTPIAVAPPPPPVSTGTGVVSAVTPVQPTYNPPPLNPGIAVPPLQTQYANGLDSSYFKTQYLRLADGKSYAISKLTKPQVMAALALPVNQTALHPAYYYDNGHIYLRK